MHFIHKMKLKGYEVIDVNVFLRKVEIPLQKTEYMTTAPYTTISPYLEVALNCRMPQCPWAYQGPWLPLFKKNDNYLNVYYKKLFNITIQFTPLRFVVQRETKFSTVAKVVMYVLVSESTSFD